MITSAVDANQPRVALLIAGGPLGNSVANHFAERFAALAIIQEEPERKWEVVKRRARLLGWKAAIGQIAFGIIYRLGEKTFSQRRQKILSDAGLSPTLRPGLTVSRVSSINSESCAAMLKSLRPDVVAVYGTRMIKPGLLQQVPAPFINYHAGITPKYRGQHSAYWALVQNDSQNAGVTIHSVDAGVDTGRPLLQHQVTFSKTDNIRTYQWVQICVSVPLFEEVIRRARDGEIKPGATPLLPSGLHFPPTVWTYFWNGLVKGVW